jgi:hypothetical protein
MSGNTIRLAAFNNVVATGLATCNLSNLFGYTIYRLILQLGGTFTKSMITGLQIKAGSKIIFDSAGSRRDTAMMFRSITANAGFLTIDFTELRAKTELGKNLGALDTTAGISTLSLELQITGATAPTLSGWAEVGAPQLDPAQAPSRGLIAKVHGSTVSIAGAGQFAVPVPHFAVSDGGSLFKRILFYSANMTALLIKKNGIVIFEMTKAANDFMQTEYKKVPQASLFVADFVADDVMSGVLNTRDAQTVECLATFSGAETFVIESEVLEPLSAY